MTLTLFIMFVFATIMVVMLVRAGWMWLHAQRQPVGHHNVNDEWTPSAALPVDDKVAA